MEKTAKIFIRLTWMVIVVSIIVRLLNLEADPLFWMDHWIGDEAYYINNARNKLLFGVWVVDEVNHGLYFSPLWTFLQFITLKIFGLSFLGFRILPAIFGGMTLILFYYFIKSFLNEKQTFWAVVFTTFSSLTIHFNRVALGESFILFFFLAALLFWIKKTSLPERKKNLYCLASGFFYGLSLLFKITSAFNFFTFMVLWFFQWQRREIKVKELFLFFVGFFCTLMPWPVLNSSSIQNLLNTNYFFTNFIWGSHPVLWMLFLGYFIWCLDRILIKKGSIHSLNPIEVVVLAIILGGALTTFLLEYQPEQRVLPFIWAMAILGSLLLTNLSEIQIDPEKFYPALKKRPKWKLYLGTFFIVLPLWLFITYSISGYTERLSWSFGNRPGIGLGGVWVLLFPLLIIGVFFSTRFPNVLKTIFCGSVVSLVFLGISRLLVNLQIYFGMGTDQILGMVIRQKQTLLYLSPLWLIGIISLMRSKVITFKNPRRPIGIIVTQFLLFHFWQGIFLILKPTYSVKILAECLAKDPLIKSIYSVYHQTPLLLTKAKLVIIYKRAPYYFIFNPNGFSEGSYGFNLVGAIPKETV